MDIIQTIINKIRFNYIQIFILVSAVMSILRIYFHNRKRGAMLKEFATSIGFSYDMMQDESILHQLKNAVLKRFKRGPSSMNKEERKTRAAGILPGNGMEELKIFQKARALEICHLISGAGAGISHMIFDYCYGSGGWNGSRYWQTIAYAQVEGLPPFRLRKKNAFHKFVEMLGFKCRNIGTFPGFPKKYLLRGEDEEAIQRVFSPYTLQYFEENDSPYRLECGPCGLVLYKPRKRLEKKHIEAVYKQSGEIATMFKRRRY
ncbi:MAG: hypothetical protein GY765_25805 [bacterium]|nr:hypothetical protein [bacterium]